jgi:hypothetical protein
MLVQGWGDKLRIFPAVPSRWQDLLFKDIKTEGAFSVSALRRNNLTRWVKIKAAADYTCNLQNPFSNQEYEINSQQIQKKSISQNNDTLSIAMKAGDEVTLYVKGYEHIDLEREAEAVRRS